MSIIDDIIRKTQARRQRDAQRFEESDNDTCMLCHAYGADKRSLFIDCLYDVSAFIPEAIDLFAVKGEIGDRGFYLRLCKSCRGDLLRRLGEWRNDRVQRRNLKKDHDGNEDKEN